MRPPTRVCRAGIAQLASLRYHSDLQIAAQTFAMTPETETLSLRAGPLSLDYDNGGLRSVKLGDAEIVRRVLVAVRDRNWGTVPNRLSNVQIEQGADWFRIKYEADSQQ